MGSNLALWRPEGEIVYCLLVSYCFAVLMKIFGKIFACCTDECQKNMDITVMY